LLSLLAAACGGGREAVVLPPEPRYEAPRIFLERLRGASPFFGELAEGGEGDWLLANERLAVVVGSEDHEGGFAVSGGNLLDAGPLGGTDVLRELFTYLNDTFPRQAIYASVAPDPEPDSLHRVLVATGVDSEDPDVAVETRYRLRAGADHVEIVTTLTNHGSTVYDAFALGDAVQWGRARAFAPGPGEALERTRPVVPWLGGAGEGTAYLLASEDSIRGPHGEAWSDPVYAAPRFGPGDAITYRRSLFVAAGSLADAHARFARDRGHDVIPVLVRAAGPDGAPLSGTIVEASTPAGRAVLRGVTAASGQVVLRLPSGTYSLRATGPAGAALDRRVAIDSAREVVFSFPEPGRVVLRAEGNGRPLAAAWTFRGLDDTPSPRFGPGYRPGRTANVFLAASGTAETLLPPGRYLVSVSAGPAYETWETELRIGSGQSGSLHAEPVGLPIPEGWYAGDLHVHALPSPDSNVSPADRIRSAACAGLAWFVGTDHGHRTAYEAVLDTLPLAGPLAVLTGEEATTTDVGHFSAFPLEVDASRPRNGAIRPQGLEPAAILSRLRNGRSDVLVQVNHPRSGLDGYFDRMRYRGHEGEADPRMTYAFDLLEIANGKRADLVETVFADWVQLLRSGHRIVGVGSSDAHGFGWDDAYPRTWVRLRPGETPGRETIPAALAAGAAVVSSGPFVEFGVEGAGVGDTVRAADGRVRAHLRVLAPRRVPVDRVTIYANGVVEKIYMVKGNDRAVRFDETVDLDLVRSSFLQVRVESGGEGEASAETAGGSAAPTAFAVTNPIWVEIPRVPR